MTSMKQNYQREVDKLEGRKIDAAFVPVDPRLEDAYFWGIDYFMRKTGYEGGLSHAFLGEIR